MAVLGGSSLKRFQLESVQIEALKAMESYAQRIGVNKGVAFISVQKDDEYMGTLKFLVVNKVMVREPEGREVEAIEAGTNYFGVAMGKLAYMMSAKNNSGTNKQLHRGEMPYQGGLIEEIGRYFIYVGFSGGTEDQDVDISRVGMAFLFSVK